MIKYLSQPKLNLRWSLAKKKYPTQKVWHSWPDYWGSMTLLLISWGVGLYSDTVSESVVLLVLAKHSDISLATAQWGRPATCLSLVWFNFIDLFRFCNLQSWSVLNNSTFSTTNHTDTSSDLIKADWKRLLFPDIIRSCHYQTLSCHDKIISSYYKNLSCYYQILSLLLLDHIFSCEATLYTVLSVCLFVCLCVPPKFLSQILKSIQCTL